MPVPEPPLTVGIEEEYWLVDRETRNLVSDPHPDLMEDYRKLLDAQVAPEFMRAQVEVGTKVGASIAEAGADLRGLRSAVAENADKYGYAIIAASTHPFAEWAEQKTTDADRYNALAEDLQTVVRRLLICGMHVHVGIGDDDMRIDFMTQMAYFLPHLLTLSTSSPFWHGRNTGLKSYRLTVFDGLPRTGLPEDFSSWGEYERHVNVLIEAGLIEDATKIWWDIRPSARYPTLEMRVTDIATRVEDTITIAALYQALLHMLYRRRRNNQRWRTYATMLIQENRWRAQRYGGSEGLMDYGRGELVAFEILTDELLTLLAQDADALGTEAELDNVRNILIRGTSADRQVAIYNEAIAGGSSDQDAMNAVVDWLIEETVTGL
ncbi:MAG: carboxylate-amine ligase [Acidimicrobiia bacterium]|nr:carboxylate-amine ligase [Acidimicrobiia bacterium]